MMLSRNPGHRVLGLRVAVPSGDFYAAATVQATRTDMTGNEFVTVKFDDNNKGECPSSEVVGNGFKAIHDIKLHRHQKVYTTHNGREVVGSVEEHRDGCVTVNILNSNESISRREDDVRLVESRYSPRLHDYILDPDYRRIASVNASPSHGKKRPVSESIEVPKKGRARKWSNEPTMDELMAAMVLSNLSNSPHFRQPRSPTVKKGGSPHSFGSSGVGSWGQDAQMSPMKGESMSQPVGASAPLSMGSPPERTQSVIHHTHSIEHSPSSIADPIEVDTSTDMDTSDTLHESNDFKSVGGVVPPGHSTPAPFRTGSPGNQFQPAQASSPPQNPAFLIKQSLKLESVKEEPAGRDDEKPPIALGYAVPRFYYIPSLMPGAAATARPELMVNLQPSGTPPPPLAMADENQYREMAQSPRRHQPTPPIYVGSPPPAIFIPVLGSSPLNSTMAFGSSAPPAPSPLATAAQMDMRGTPPRQASTTGIGMTLVGKQAQPINIPGIKSFSWHNSGVPQSYPPKHSLVMQRQHLHRASSPKSSFQMSPKAPHPGRKIRGDGRKCRKIYGMENRDMWCTACRWKKACQRFPD